MSDIVIHQKEITQFFITGLPRTRSSWFASFLSSGDTFCWHEALNGCNSRDDFYSRMRLPGYSAVGNADCGLALTDFQQHFVGKTLIVHRPLDEVVRSLRGVGIRADAFLLDFLKSLQKKQKQLKGWHIKFSDIDRNIEGIHQYLTGKQPDPNRLKLFLNMRVEPAEISGDLESLKVWI